jgi:hypothetical protein
LPDVLSTIKNEFCVKPTFPVIFARLRSILEPHAHRFKLSADTPSHYCLVVPYSAKFKKGYPVAWAKISKAYVSYHFMPVYMFPNLVKHMSPKLKARMQGKSCFNFKVADEALFLELEQITTNGFRTCRESGLV